MLKTDSEILTTYLGSPPGDLSSIEDRSDKQDSVRESHDEITGLEDL